MSEYTITTYEAEIMNLIFDQQFGGFSFPQPFTTCNCLIKCKK